MATAVTINIDGVVFEAELNDSAIAGRVAELLPANVRMSRWGEEYYGSIGLGADNADGAIEVVEVGAIAYWPPGDALCFFFGPTPVSRGSEPRAASEVTVIGRFTSDNVRELSGLGGSILAEIKVW